MIGKTPENFEIISQSGKGSMGEVDQAKDRKLGRDVAIKVLLEEFARDTDTTEEDEATAAGPRKINIVPNWFEELKEGVPVE